MNYSGNQAWNPTFPFIVARDTNDCIFAQFEGRFERNVDTKQIKDWGFVPKAFPNVIQKE